MTGKHKTRLVGWHPSDPAAVGWLDAEIGRRGGGRGAQSAILDGALEKAMNDIGTTRLTDYDRRSIDQVRELAAVRGPDAIREVTGDDDDLMAAFVFIGRLQHHIRDLLAIIDRGGGQPAAQITEADHG